MRRSAFLVLALVGLLAAATGASARVLRVGTYHRIKGQFSSLQAAVDAAKPGDWILVGPGDYKEHRGKAPSGRADLPSGVLISTPRLRVRGMNRNTVIVDGTKAGAPVCSVRRSDQEWGPPGSGGAAPLGLNGVLVWKADNVWVQNLTVCNYLGGSGTAGNEIWWNGGDGSGTIGGWGFYGSYLTATSTFYADESTAAAYGIFSSNWSGGTWDRTYTSNFNDSGYYIGACQVVCDQTVDHAHSEYNALGYSGTNSGGQLVVENSEFDHNEDGFDTNSQNNSDWPSPQDGACPGGAVSPITHTHSCWVFVHNFVHDNNNPNVPSSGAAAAGPVGTGLSLSGARDDTVLDNRFQNNGAWGVIFVPYPDLESPPPGTTTCTGGISAPGNVCHYDDWGNALVGNTFTHNGFFGNDTNADFAEATTTAGHAINCYRGNSDAQGNLTSSPTGLQQSNGSCGQTALIPDVDLPFTSQVLCDSQFLGAGSTPCPPGANYPRRTAVIMHPLPRDLATMPNPCAGVPANPWCPAKPRHKRSKKRRRPPSHGSSGGPDQG
ncbi:MAG: hypothetical protein JO206_15510 [Solirubrobacterales bacterium]|nr:hypothetical protein [Solirubrobacterales bacterium]MBV9474371.1 hypothetical protein [Solirubrobacterales bacterium]MBV9837542.1 hypothetical protein [Solirubrobacterales bacterium]